MFKTMLSNFRSAFASSTGKICLGLFYTPLSSTNIKFYKKKIKPICSKFIAWW